MNFEFLSSPCLLILLLIILCCGAIDLTASAPDQSGCRLNFTTFPYQPVGGCCGKVSEKLENWNGFPRLSCCQNALTALSHALALQALADPQHNIFMDKDQWGNCSTPFTSQTEFHVQNCGFGDFYDTSARCTTLQLASIDPYVTKQCSLFGTSPFDDACGRCTVAITGEVGNKIDYFDVKGSDTEYGLCLVAVIVAVIAAKMQDSSPIGDFDRCLPALLTPAPANYFRVTYGAAEAILSVVLVMLGLTAVIKLIKHVNKKTRKPEKKTYQDITGSCPGLYRFSKTEIENAIHYGPEKKFLGRGSAGQVYKGMLPSGQLVAVKHIFKTNTSDSFTREIDQLSRVRHPNLVCLFGCCIEDGEQYLVYEFCPNGNLAQQLLRKDTSLTWELRVKILRDCAYALKYLHTHTDGCIVHRDIKLTNILLTQNMEPKLSDFGLAKMLGMEESKVFTDVRGTIGYMDPEYMSNAKLTCASDIYSFGIVMLQLLSGQRVIELDLDARDQLTRKAKDVNSGKRPLIDFQDTRMKGGIVSVDFESILQIAVLCVAGSSTGRPTVEVVFEELDKALKNTQAEMKARKEKSLLIGTPSKSHDLICV